MYEPVAVNERVLSVWRAVHEQSPMLELRCDGARGACRQVVGRVWATPEGPLLWTVTHVPARRVEVVGNPTVGELAGIEALIGSTTIDRYTPETGTARSPALLDERGEVTLLRGDYWFGAEVGCGRHDVVDLDRERLVRTVRSTEQATGTRSARLGEVTVRQRS